MCIEVFMTGAQTMLITRYQRDPLEIHWLALYIAIRWPDQITPSEALRKAYLKSKKTTTREKFFNKRSK